MSTKTSTPKIYTYIASDCEKKLSSIFKEELFREYKLATSKNVINTNNTEKYMLKEHKQNTLLILNEYYTFLYCSGNT